MKIRDIPDIENFDPYILLEAIFEKNGILDIILEPSHIYLALTKGEFFIGFKNNKLSIESTKGDWFEATWSFSEVRAIEIRPDRKAIIILMEDHTSIKFFLDISVSIGID